MNNTSIKSTRTILLLCLLVGLLAFPSSAEASTFVVNTVDDLDDGSCDADHCSLREAIDAANANPGTDTIAFDIPGAGPHTIKLCALLPKLTDGARLLSR
jgi:CSLREA domain-containing protein